MSDLVLPHLGSDPVEIGSGLGDYAASWIEAGQSHVTVSDADPSRHALLQDRFAAEPRVTVVELDVFEPYSGRHSAMVALNVLEHIEDDTAALAAAHRLLRPGGRVVMFVPAFPIAMSPFDRAVGHFRRHRRPSLRAAYERAGSGPNGCTGQYAGPARLVRRHAAAG